MKTLTLWETDIWHIRRQHDIAANALADRHYSRRPSALHRGRVGSPGRKLVLVTPCERALWITYWASPKQALDGLDAWRCSVFRNEGAGRSSDLIRAAMELTAERWAERPRDGWVTWVDRTKVNSAHPGYCFKQAGWKLDREWSHRRLIRLRAEVD